MKTIIKSTALLTAVLSMTACTSVISKNVNEDGTVGGEVTFPDMKNATLEEGIFPNLDNLAVIGNGVSKKQLYQLIGRPHFHEVNGAREWDYIMKFRNLDDSVRTCQYKVIFDKDKIARSFFWKPADCLKPKTSHLSTDALFDFNKGGVGDLKAEGKEKLTEFAKQVIAAGNKDKLVIVGYTDYLGKKAYNQQLSEERANTVKTYLLDQGIEGSNMTAKGMGENNPVVQCENTGNRAELIDCLMPNRRVTISVK